MKSQMAVNYQPINWVNGQAPALNAANLNHMDEGIKAAVDEINNVRLVLANTEVKANKISSFDVNFSDAEKYPTVLAVKKFLDEYYYTFEDVDSALTGKADKSTTLAGYGITDAYTSSYIDKLLNNKLDKMGFDSEPKLNSPNYLTSGTVYTALQKKADKSTASELQTEITSLQNSLSELSNMIYANEYAATLVIDDDGTTFSDNNGDVMLADWKLKEA